jgi:small subunit ribosomal protein S15
MKFFSVPFFLQQQTQFCFFPLFFSSQLRCSVSSSSLSRCSVPKKEGFAMGPKYPVLGKKQLRNIERDTQRQLGSSYRSIPFLDALLASQAESTRMFFSRLIQRSEATITSNASSNRLDDKDGVVLSNNQDLLQTSQFERLLTTILQNQDDSSKTKYETLVCLSPLTDTSRSPYNHPLAPYQYNITEAELSSLFPHSSSSDTSSSLLRQIISINDASQHQLNLFNKHLVMTLLQAHALDTGSAEVQIGLLTLRIGYLCLHLKTHRKDFQVQKKLIQMIQRRRRVLHYLKRLSLERYFNVLSLLSIQHTDVV